MKQRVISAIVALVILAAALALFNTYAFNVVVAAIVLLATFELLHAEGCAKDRVLLGAACLYAALIPLIPLSQMENLFLPLSFCYIVALFLILLRHHEQISALQVSFSFFISLLIPFSLTVSLYLRDRLGAPTALFYILMALSIAWFSDTSAYFVGRACGRHKLSPLISPKKTMEGAAGGIVGGTVCTLLMALFYQWAAGTFFGITCEIRYGLLALFLPLLSVAGILGDLSASVVKRQTGMKDYGNIMPGHGGVVDRFDSVFFTAPCVFFIVRFITLFRVL